MRTHVVTLAAIVVLAVCGTAALAADFECSVLKVGDQFTYTLLNNHASYDVVEWCLRWSCDDATNTPLALANFKTVAGTGYISFPSQWERSEADDEPRFATLDDVAAIMHGGNQKSFAIQYKASDSTPAPLFRVAVIESNVWVGWQDCMAVPEPGSIAILLTGLAGAGLLFRRKTR